MRRNAKRKKLIRIFTATTVIVAIALGILIFSAKNKNTSSVVAIVNGEQISKSEVDQKLRIIFEGQNFSNQAEYKPIEAESLPKEVIEILVKEIYLEKQLTKEAQKSKVAKLDETKNKIAESTARILRQSYIDSVIKAEVTDQKISDKYAELTNEIVGKKEYAISHIVLKTKAEAEKIAKEFKAKKPAKFSDLARKYSVDQESGQRGGDLGYILEDNIVKEISTEIAKLKKDQISQPVETKFGWHLIKFTDIREAKALPFEEVKENIREQLYQDALNKINSKITKDLKIQVLISAKEQPKVDAIEESKEEITAAPTTETEEKSKEEASDKTEEEQAAGEKSQINADEKSKKSSKK